MKILLYVLAAIAGLFGLLALLRSIELLLTGGGVQPVQIGIAVICFVLVWLWVRSGCCNNLELIYVWNCWIRWK